MLKNMALVLFLFSFDFYLFSSEDLLEEIKKSRNEIEIILCMKQAQRSIPRQDSAINVGIIKLEQMGFSLDSPELFLAELYEINPSNRTKIHNCFSKFFHSKTYRYDY